MANPAQLFLLADHIKLSLLERQRAISLNLEPNSQDGQISRSLESFRDGLEAVDRESARLEGAGDAAFETYRDQATRLQRQYDDLTAQFRGFPTASASSPSLTQPNDPALSPDFTHAQSNSSRPRVPSSSSFLKRPPTGTSNGANSPKSVRFSDSPAGPADEEAANRASLFPYRDDPSDATAPPDHSALDNQQIHSYHSEVLAEQDEQLDRLGESIGRQRELSMQIGDELDGHVQLLDEVDGHVERHQTRLDQAKRRLGGVARRAGENLSMTVILVLIVVLVLLIVILKG
ncbi:MAG: hypothetical protein M1832_000526 [Thelocarpon impressellum]|nr:MAG: hypothetical protein M1832_000526 [Thelocarpon impressellum]